MSKNLRTMSMLSRLVSAEAIFLSSSEKTDFALALSLARLDAGKVLSPSRSAEWVLNGKAIGQEALAQSSLLARDNTLILSFFRSHGMMAAPMIPLELDLLPEAPNGAPAEPAK